MTEPRAPWLEVVMPTYNRPKAAVRALERIAVQDGADGIAVVLVDDGSEQPVEPQLPASLRERLEIRVLRLENGGPARARNAGIAASTAEYIAFVDDDVDVDLGWLAAFTAAVAANSGPVAFIGPLAAPRNWKPSPWIHWEAETLAIEYQRMVDGVYEPTWRQFFTGNAVVRRDYLVDAGGFDESFTRAEDIELGLRMQERCGVSFQFVPDAIGWHYAHRTLDAWLRIPRAYGECDIRIDALHPRAGHRATLAEELANDRNAISRALRRPARNDAFRGATVFLATRAAIVATGAGAHRLSTRLLSLAYDVEHTNAFYRAAEQADASASGEQPINSPSTGGGYAQPR